MAKKKWYQSRTNQAAIIGGIFLLGATIIGALIYSRKNSITPPLQKSPTVSSNHSEQLKSQIESKGDTSILKLSPVDLIAILGKYPNEIQAEEAYNKFYRGSIVEWNGVVSLASTMMDRYRVFLNYKNEIGISAFFEKDWSRRLSVLKKGDELWIRGRLGIFASPQSFILDSCVILDR